MNSINKPELKTGETYAGAIINPDGTGNHIILIAGDKDKGTWDDAMDWAKELGGDLPNRVESALLFNQSKDQFKPEWYWTNEQPTSYPDSAWFQFFGHGLQGYSRKAGKLHARAVRRVTI